MVAKLKSPVGQFFLLLAFALIWRCDTFGDPNLAADEAFYHMVGLAMHDGAIPYVDIWDRKPWGLFAVYWVITAISSAPIAYQIAACLASALTGSAIAALGQKWSNWQGGMLAALAYILWLAPLQGFGGQAPVFYNPFIAFAALLVVRALPQLRAGIAPRSVSWAMLLAGLAITIKTTALFEATFFGLVAAFALARSKWGWQSSLAPIAFWMAIGALPSLAIAATYGAIGHWHEFWHAMVTSNLAKPKDLLTGWIRLRLMYVALIPLLVPALFGLTTLPREGRHFILLWLAAAFVSMLAVGNFYIHHAMPLTLPLCVAAAAFLSRKLAGPVALAMIAAMSAWIEPPFRFEHTARSIAQMDELVRTVKAHDAGRDLLTFEGPAHLYPLAGKRVITPLVFSMHLSAQIEKDVSHLSTLAEMRRILALKPGIVVIADPIRNGPVNRESEALVQTYVHTHCRFIGKRTLSERLASMDFAIWGDCRT